MKHDELGPRDERVCLPLRIAEIDVLMKLIDLDDEEEMTEQDEAMLRGIRRSLAARRTKVRRKIEANTGTRPT